MTIEQKPLWVLGYGSLIFKPPPHAKYVIPGVIHGYTRRFWQSSSDHRGTPEHKGRVVTLIPYDDIKTREEFIKDLYKYEENLHDEFHKNDLKVWACAYYIPAEFSQEVTEYLNVREQDGYTIHNIPFLLHHDPLIHNQSELVEAINQLPKDHLTGKHVLTSVVYIGTVDNESFIGPETIEDTANVISEAQGPSGANWEYLEKLYHSLKELDKNGKDNYLEKLVEKVIEVRKEKGIDLS
ncbi:Cation transport regulator-like protein [Wickerhamomyces ciferrii]|uniref:glutathione-specific gamma-glutamylcyclotransferase n=1 Tax=Wickerhamomyces ciferrii (strain ATCC 14091 / BCRC 22168 / CBS 111 / JCM 3599 / NBRC 0793 / NRRL Y-1031 F-60-10) TaxID=1206466 RepID=K0KYS6_WICCF|nr:Cation transport regulator-like protein [Wickerhamomyces ciferrii]CCH46233.1 Cation transport regulator-like protein [Wickerhamomyces ciferrii]